MAAAGDPGAKQAGALLVRTYSHPNGIVLGTDLMCDPRQNYLKCWMMESQRGHGLQSGEGGRRGGDPRTRSVLKFVAEASRNHCEQG